MIVARRTLIMPDGRKLDYAIDRGKRKNIYITVKNGAVVLKLPVNADERQGERFLIEKAEWILKSLDPARSEASIPDSFREGESFTLAGREYTVSTERTAKYRKPRFEDGRLIVSCCSSCTPEYIARQAEKAVTEEAERLIRDSFARLTALTGLTPAKVTLKKMKASWGRCSSTGNISININVVFYPQECIDYVVLHELCHLKYMDHSKQFWQLVSAYCPDWKSIRARMKG